MPFSCYQTNGENKVLNYGRRATSKLVKKLPGRKRSIPWSDYWQVVKLANYCPGKIRQWLVIETRGWNLYKKYFRRKTKKTRFRRRKKKENTLTTRYRPRNEARFKKKRSTVSTKKKKQISDLLFFSFYKFLPLVDTPNCNCHKTNKQTYAAKER